MNAAHTYQPFGSFILKEQGNRRLLWIALAVITIEWITFKIAYPFPDFFSDSYSYIDAAARRLDINIWPIGYSKFLLIFHNITHSDTALVTFQYMGLQSAVLYFYFTLLYAWRPSRAATIVLFAFLFVNPLFFYLSNYVSSDGLFCALTLLWFTELLWLFLRPGRPRIWMQTVCVFVAFTFRYNALYYPLITGLAFLLSRQKTWAKWVGTLAIVPFLIAFWLFSLNAGEKLTGKPLSSILGGWQLANNALYMRGQIVVDTTRWPSPASAELDSISRVFFRRVGPDFKPILDANPGNFFIQFQKAPLKIYTIAVEKHSSIRAWADVSPTFGEYGTFLIRTHPIGYVHYYLAPNVAHYFMPSIEKLAIYNLGWDTVEWPAQYWFHYRNRQIKVISPLLQGELLQIYPYVVLIINLFFLGAMAWIVITGIASTMSMVSQKVLILVTCFWVLNFCFSVFANIIVLRYQFFPLILFFSFFAIVYEYLDQKKQLNIPHSKLILPNA